MRFCTLPCLALLLAGAASSLVPGAMPQEKPPETRVPWTTSKVHGSPEPPPPYRLERVFPKLNFPKLTHMASAPGTDRLFVCTELGKIYSFPPVDAVPKADLCLDLPREVKSCQPGGPIKGFDQLYCLAFHPKFADNRHVYICYTVDGKDAPPKSPSAFKNRERVSRFTMDRADPPRIDPASEKIIIEWPTEKGGHNGGCLCFGPDGCLYISMGDAGPASPPDRNNTGQDLSDLLSSILRIDVDHAQEGKGYLVPADNPFVKTPGARPEIWAYGLRNPWKMSFDRARGDLWVGDVGWEMYEMIYRVQKGGNYGWSIMEGPQAVHPKRQRGPTPILPPQMYFSHADAASITGGYVYRGKRLPGLVGTYLCGDWMTCKVWSTRFDGDRVVSHQEIAQGRMRIVGFGEDNDGELYILGYGDSDGIYRLVPAAAKANTAKFPRKLSETGLFSTTAPLTPAPGVLPYTIVAEPWRDHATAERLVALPELSTVQMYEHSMPVPNTAWFRSRVFFPGEAVLVKTMGIEMERGKPASLRRLETQILHFDGDNWFGYTYRWNEAQTDAELVPAGGAEMDLTIADADAPGGKRVQTWRFASRGQCLVCHNGWAGPPLGFGAEQLNTPGQLQRLQQLKAIAPASPGKGKPPATVRTQYSLANPYGGGQDVAMRARSYLGVNCAQCHQGGAGGTATIDLRPDIPARDMRALGNVPVQGAFNIPDARLVAPGDPESSVLYYRMAKTGPGRMPHIGSEIVDVLGVDLIHQWIAALPSKGEAANLHAVEKTALQNLLATKAKDAAKNPALDQLLASTPGALLLARALDKKEVPPSQRGVIVARAATRPEGEIRDLFERFLPADQRVKRLGTIIQPQSILALKGDSDRGRLLFYKTAGLQCAVCHKVDGVGGVVGPDLSQIGKKYDRAKILESIVDPSKEIEPAYVSYAVQLKDGRIVTGVIVVRNDKELVLRDAQAKEHRFAGSDVDTVSPQRQSLMPEQLLRDLTAQQAADLVEFLAGLKGPS